MCLTIIRNLENTGCGKNCSLCKANKGTGGVKVKTVDTNNYYLQDFSNKDVLLARDVILAAAVKHLPQND